MLRLIGVLMALTVTWSAPAWAGLDDATVRDMEMRMFAARDAGDHQQVIQLLTRLAAESDFFLYHGMLGAYYDAGEVVPRDPALAARHYRVAAVAGHPQSQTRMGVMYLHGDGVPRDDDQAIHWLERAAYIGETDAQLRLGALLSDPGREVRDDRRAYFWLKEALDQGEGLAGILAGQMWERGTERTRQNDENALLFYRRAAEAGEPTGYFYWGLYQAGGMGGLVADEAAGLTLMKKSADLGSPIGAMVMAVLYAEGDGFPVDDQKSGDYLDRAGAVLSENGLSPEILEGMRDLLAKHAPDHPLFSAVQTVINKYWESRPFSHTGPPSE